MDRTFSPQEVDALVRRAAIALRESVKAQRASLAASNHANDKDLAFRAARDDLDAYLDGAIHRAEKRLEPFGTISAETAFGMPIVFDRTLSEDEIRIAYAAERGDTGGGACA